MATTPDPTTAHPAATEHLPAFITAPGETDVLMVVMGVILVVSVLAFGILFLRLHTLPERMAHRAHKLQFEIVAVLGLIALFTHMHIFLGRRPAACDDRPSGFRRPAQPDRGIGREARRSATGRRRTESRPRRRHGSRARRRSSRRAAASPRCRSRRSPGKTGPHAREQEELIHA